MSIAAWTLGVATVGVILTLLIVIMRWVVFVERRSSRIETLISGVISNDLPHLAQGIKDLADQIRDQMDRCVRHGAKTRQIDRRLGHLEAERQGGRGSRRRR